MAPSESSEKIKENLIALAKRNDWWLTTILGVAAIALIVTVSFIAIHYRVTRVEDHKVTVEFVPLKQSDPNGKLVTTNNVIISKEALDSIVYRLERHEAIIAEKYTSILKKREEEDNYKTIIMLVFGIIVSIAGFFGYSSISDIRKRVTEMAETKATEIITATVPGIAQKTAETEAQKYCKENIENLVTDYLTKHLQALINTKVDELFKSEGRSSIVQEITQEVNGKVLDHFKTDEWKETTTQIIDMQLPKFLAEDAKILPSLKMDAVKQQLKKQGTESDTSDVQTTESEKAPKEPSDSSSIDQNKANCSASDSTPTPDDLFGAATK